jgi:hypothetical protein
MRSKKEAETLVWRTACGGSYSCCFLGVNRVFKWSHFRDPKRATGRESGPVSNRDQHSGRDGKEIMEGLKSSVAARHAGQNVE